MTLLTNDVPLLPEWQIDRAQRPSHPNAEIRFRFDGFQLLPRERLLFENGRRVRIGDRPLDVLITLVERQGGVVSNADLMSLVWGPVQVEEGTLRVQIAALRKALADGKNGRRLIVNVVGRGYVFVGALH